MANDRNFIEKIQALVASDDVRISAHGYDELAADRLFATELIEGLANAVLVENYPDYPKGHVFSCDKCQIPVIRSTPFGESPRGTIGQLFW